MPATSDSVRRASAAVTGGGVPARNAAVTSANCAACPLGVPVSCCAHAVSTSSQPGAGVTRQSSSRYPYRWVSSTVARSKSKRR